MQIEVESRNLIKHSTLRTYAKRRLSFAFDRHEQYINRITVRLSDINGPRGGEDKNCRLQLFLPKIGNVNVNQVDEDIFAAIDKAADRASRVVASKVTKQRDKYRHLRHPKLLNDATKEPSPSEKNLHAQEIFEQEHTEQEFLADYFRKLESITEPLSDDKRGVQAQ